ncbi:MAG: HAD family phosphatase [Butyrivibrio sp.]|nr:HAD family phosphatase [Butyrivibrio sp.]
MITSWTILFDMDGVLFDSERASLDCWQTLSGDYQLTNVEEVYRRCIGGDVRHTRSILVDAYPHLTGSVIDEMLSRCSALFHEKYDHDGIPLPMKPGAREILEDLSAQGIPLGLASSTRKATVLQQLKNADLLRYFQEVIGGDEVATSKPSPEIYETIRNRMGANPARCAAIEDSFNGVRAAHAAGCHTIMVPDMIPADDEMRGLAAVICEDLFAAQRYIHEL